MKPARQPEPGGERRPQGNGQQRRRQIRCGDDAGEQFPCPFRADQRQRLYHRFLFGQAALAAEPLEATPQPLQCRHRAVPEIALDDEAAKQQRIAEPRGRQPIENLIVGKRVGPQRRRCRADVRRSRRPVPEQIELPRPIHPIMLREAGPVRQFGARGLGAQDLANRTLVTPDGAKRRSGVQRNRHGPRPASLDPGPNPLVSGLK